MIYLVGLPDTQGGMSYLTTAWVGDPARTYSRKLACEFKSEAAATKAIEKSLKETSPFTARTYKILTDSD